jgi:hypothetical protein
VTRLVPVRTVLGQLPMPLRLMLAKEGKTRPAAMGARGPRVRAAAMGLLRRWRLLRGRGAAR